MLVALSLASPRELSTTIRQAGCLAKCPYTRERREPDNAAMATRYVRPDWFTANVFNPFVALLTRAGLSVYGSRVLAVRGRQSGQWRTNPVNLLNHQGERYLVAPRGVTQWVRNIRASGATR